MATVERGNVVLQIADDDIQRYLDKGYSVTDGYGHILQQAMPTDVGELRALVIKYEAEIEELKAQLEELLSYEEEVPEEIVEEKPKRGRRKKVVEE